MNERAAEILTEQFGGNLWERHGHRRVYFEGAAIAQRQGLTWENYNSGNICAAWLDGERISNSEAKRILQGFQWHKIWFDLNSGQFATKGVGYQSEIEYPACRRMYEQFVADVLVAIAEEES